MKKSLMILGETTGNKRSKKDYLPLGTNAERYIWEALSKYNYSRNDFHIYSIYKDRGHKKRELSEEDLLELQIGFRRELIMAEPDIILSVGRLPTQELLQTKLGGQFYEYVGQYLYSTEYEVWFVPTIHPTMVARDPDKLMILEKGIEAFHKCVEEL